SRSSKPWWSATPTPQRRHPPLVPRPPASPGRSEPRRLENMLLSRFWIVLLSLALGASAFTLYVAAQLYNHAGSSAMGEALTANVNAVDWYLREDSRKRSTALIQIALSPELRDGLAKASGDVKVDKETRFKVRGALNKLVGEVHPDLKFDAVWA